MVDILFQAYDSEGVGVSDIPKGSVGKTVTFAGNAMYLYPHFKPSYNSNCCQ